MTYLIAENYAKNNFRTAYIGIVHSLKKQLYFTSARNRAGHSRGGPHGYRLPFCDETRVAALALTLGQELCKQPRRARPIGCPPDYSFITIQ